MVTSTLLIDDNDSRRVATLKTLLRRGHQVTMASSFAEAEEILQFVTARDIPPSRVVIADHMMEESGPAFRRGLTDRFGDLQWVALSADQHCGLDVLLIEEDDQLRAAITARLGNGHDRLTACRSLAEAGSVLEGLADTSPGPHVIVCGVSLDVGNGISFYLAANRRFPDTRWIVTASRSSLPTLPGAIPATRIALSRIV